MQVLRTVPFEGVTQVEKLARELDRIISRWGFRERVQTGSVSWVTRAGRSFHTFFKLVHLGGGMMQFGLSKPVVRQNEKLKRVDWPTEFAVLPKARVVFVGFRIANDRSAINRVRMIMNAFGEPQVESKRPKPYDEEADRRLDVQLKEAGLVTPDVDTAEQDAIVGASVVAALASLPHEDFSDWEK
jgi:hypothetical protein